MGSFNHNDYASKGVAGTGLGLGIAGTALSLLANNGCGLLGNLFGGNCNNGRVAEVQYVSQLQAENARLKAENYSDKVAKETYIQALADNKSLRDELYAYIKPLADEAANNRVNIATLQSELKCCCEKNDLKDEILKSKISELGLALNNKVDRLDQIIACISGKVNDITQTIIPKTAVCPEPMSRYNSWTAPTTPSQSA